MVNPKIKIIEPNVKDKSQRRFRPYTLESRLFEGSLKLCESTKNWQHLYTEPNLKSLLRLSGNPTKHKRTAPRGLNFRKKL